MQSPLTQNAVTCCCTGLAVLVLLAAGQALFAASEHPANDANSRIEADAGSVGADAADPNELLWKQWDAAAEHPDDPNELIQAKLNAVINVLQSDDLRPTLKPLIIEKIISPIFDFELMSMLALGRTHWPKLTPDEQKKFTGLFTERLKQSYREKIMLYKDQKIQLGPAMPQRRGISISMDILSDGIRFAVLYQLRKVEGHWRIYDVEIEGVSILMIYRSQFDDIMRRGDIKNLFSQLEKSTTP